MKIKTMVMFTNSGTLEFKDEYNVMNFFQFNPYYVFDKCDEDELKGSLVQQAMQKYPNSIFQFSISFVDGQTGKIHISRYGKMCAFLIFNYSDVIEEIKEPTKAKDYYRLTKVLGGVL